MSMISMILVHISYITKVFFFFLKRISPLPLVNFLVGVCVFSIKFNTVFLQGNKLWGGRFSGKTDHVMEAFNASISYDKRMWKADIQV